MKNRDRQVLYAVGAGVLSQAESGVIKHSIKAVVDAEGHNLVLAVREAGTEETTQSEESLYHMA